MRLPQDKRGDVEKGKRKRNVDVTKDEENRIMAKLSVGKER